ncbi:MAG: hypothetical protein RR543_00035 [Erysipelotrichales bacterium]
MFKRNDNDFDNLEEYRRQRPSVDNYFEREDEFNYGKINQERETNRNQNQNKTDYMNDNSDLEGSGPTRPQYTSPKANGGLNTLFKTIGILLIAGFIALVIIGVSESDDSLSDKGENDTEYSLEDYEKLTYRGENTITSKQFVKLYNDAKKNRIKYDRLTKKYISGDYKKNYVVNERYLESQSSIEYETKDGEEEGTITYTCLKDKETDTDNGETKYGKLISCGIASQLEEGNYPEDILADKKIDLYNYLPHNSESMDRYYINGVYYSQELADLIVKEASIK